MGGRRGAGNPGSFSDEIYHGLDYAFPSGRDPRPSFRRRRLVINSFSK